MPFGLHTSLFKKKDNRTIRDVRDTQSPEGDVLSEPEASIDTSQFGMFILEDKPSELAKVVDVVAIHGLNGHYLNTWTTTDAAGQKVVWLKDLLPKQLPDARIMSYGYNSALQFSKSVAGIGTFAEQLLEDLRSWRGTQAERDRPIVFICHSLGGIVVKQALIRAHERDRFSSLLAHVCGIAFFGTPHRGADLASWATMMGNILWAASFGTSTNTKFAKELKSRSEVLDNISKSFVERGKGLKILSFYETDKMDNLNCLASPVVEKQSATLDLPNEAPIALNGNHRTICRFSSENEQRYRTVWSNLQEMITTVIINETLSEAETACLSSLYISDYEGHRDRIEVPSRGHAKASSMLWVSADPGCGKSVLTSFLVDAQTSDNTGATICYFFFKDDNDQQRRSNYAVAAILHQIYTSQPGLIKHALKWHQAKATSVSTSFPNLWKVFIETVEDEHARDIICLVDALDECQAASCEDFMAALVTYISSTNQRRSRPSNLKVLITSRPENSIKRGFQKLPRIRLRGEDETDSISRDVAMLVQANIDQLQDARLPRGLLANLQKQLIEGADRTFLWVALIIQLLKDASDRDIDEVYNRLLQRSAAPLRAKPMLQVVLAATSPLSLDELSVATAINWKHKTLKDLEGDLIHPFDNYIRTLCGNFLRIVHGKVYLVHQTARQFLLKPHPSKTSTSVADTGLPDLESRIKYGEAALERLLDHMFPSASVDDEEFENDKVQQLMGARVSKEFKRKLFDQAKRILTKVNASFATDKIPYINEIIKEILAKVKTEEDESLCLEELQTKLNEARAETAKRKFREVTTEFKKSDKQLKSAKQGFFNNSMSLSEAHYYLLKACIHFLCLVPTESQRSITGPTIEWMEPFFAYAASAWPIHYSESLSEQTAPTIQLCKALCSPRSPSFPFWTTHNELYNLKFPPGRMDIKGESTDHGSEVSKAFLGLIVQKESIVDKQARGYDLILEAKDSDEDEDDGVLINKNGWTEAGQHDFEGQEHLGYSYRFREYWKAEMRSSESIVPSGGYIPNSFLKQETKVVSKWATFLEMILLGKVEYKKLLHRVHDFKIDVQQTPPKLELRIDIKANRCATNEKREEADY
ncbi:hypothetical protein DL98DRAFT_569779 [Cadophora sp. DSE1049]|nr:hypothetical protein DL98DRAFT_569779 [Cadophora sp. DSE1049]